MEAVLLLATLARAFRVDVQSKPRPVPEPSVDDVDVSAEPVASGAPPKLPPLPAMPPLPPAPPPAAAPSSIVPPAPAAASRSPMFYVGILVGVLVVSAAVGTVVALSRRRPAPAAAAMPSASGAAAPKVITIGTIEMDDNPDSGP